MSRIVYYFIRHNYSHANIISKLSLNHFSVNATVLIAEYRYTPKLVEMVTCWCKLFDSEILGYSIIIFASFGLLQFPIMRQVVLMDLVFNNKHDTMLV